MRAGLTIVAAASAAASPGARTRSVRSVAIGAPRLDWVARLRDLARAFAAYRRRRAAARELSALDDRMLRDIGFHRDEIASVVAEVTGDAAPTRVRVLRDLGRPAI